MRYVRLPEIAKMGSGGTPLRKNKEYYANGTIPWLKSGELNNGPVISAEEYITEKALEESSAKIAPKKSLLVAMYGATAGKVGILDFDSSMNQAICFIIPDKDQVIVRYLYYYLMSKNQELLDKREGGGQPNINQKILKNLKIPLPSLSKQKAIVAKLDRAQRLIDIDKKMLVKYDELIQSVFLEMFGEGDGEKVPLSSLVKLNPRKSEISDIDKSMEASFLGMANVGENGSLNLSEIKTVKESWKGYTYFKEGDVLFAKITPCMENGKGAIATGLKNGLGFGSTEFHVLRPIEGVSRAAWIYHLTHSDKFRVIAESFMTGSAGQKRVPTHFFDRFKVAKPTIEKQIRFEEIAKEISKDKRRLRSQINKSEELFSSLVQEAFSNDL